MNARQCLGLGLIGGVVALAVFLFLRRNESAILKFINQKIFTLISVVALLILILGIIFATPVTSDQLTDGFYVLLIIVGVLQSSLGCIGYFIFPETIAQRMDVSSHTFFQRDIGVTYLAIGVMCIIAGAEREQPLGLVFFFTLFCWGRLYLVLNFVPPNGSDDKKESTGDEAIPSRYYTFETYVNAGVPLLLGSFYLTAVDI